MLFFEIDCDADFSPIDLRNMHEGRGNEMVDVALCGPKTLRLFVRTSLIDATRTPKQKQPTTSPLTEHSHRRRRLRRNMSNVHRTVKQTNKQTKKEERNKQQICDAAGKNM